MTEEEIKKFRERFRQKIFEIYTVLVLLKTEILNEKAKTPDADHPQLVRVAVASVQGHLEFLALPQIRAQNDGLEDDAEKQMLVEELWEELGNLKKLVSEVASSQWPSDR